MRTVAKARQYSHLLLNIAEQKDALDETYNSLSAFFAAYRRQPQLKAALASTQINSEQKEGLLVSVFADLHPIVTAFVVKLGEEKDLKLLGQIVHHVELGYYQRSNQVRVEAVTTESLSPELESSIRKTVESVTSRSADFSSRVDEDLLGGMTLRVGNTILDGSLASRLAQIRDSLTES